MKKNDDVETKFEVDGETYIIARLGGELDVSDEARNQLMSFNA